MRTCREYVSTYSWYHGPCGRPVKTDGLCGIHLRTRDNRKRRDEAAKARLAESDDAHARALAMVAKLGELGIKAWPYYAQSFGSHPGRYTGQVILDGQEVLDVVASLSHTTGTRE